MTVSCGYKNIESRSISTIFKTKTIFHDISLPLKNTTNNQVTLCVRPSPPRSKCTFEKMHHIKVAAFAATMTAFEKKKIMRKPKCQASYLSCMELKTKYSLGYSKCEIRGSSKICFFKVCYKPPQHVLLIAFPFKMLFVFLCKLVNCKKNSSESRKC